MFNSGISVKELIDELISEVDIALVIPNATYVSWLNSLQQTLYTEIIKEQKKITITEPTLSPVDISSLGIVEGENRPRFDDIYAMYADDVQLIKSTVTSGVIFPNTFYKDNNNIGYHTETTPTKLTIVYIVKPALVEVDENDEIDGSYVMVPAEFIDLVKAKLRGEAYKLANETELAAMWLNDYNVLLETFKAWIAEKAPKFGM
jgi:hypothetical protein